MRETIPEDLKDVLEMVQSGTVHIGGKFAVQLIERIAKAEARNKVLEEALREARDLISEERGWGTHRRMEGSELYSEATRLRNKIDAALREDR